MRRSSAAEGSVAVRDRDDRGGIMGSLRPASRVRRMAEGNVVLERASVRERAPAGLGPGLVPVPVLKLGRGDVEVSLKCVPWCAPAPRRGAVSSDGSATQAEGLGRGGCLIPTAGDPPAPRAERGEAPPRLGASDTASDPGPSPLGSGVTRLAEWRGDKRGTDRVTSAYGVVDMEGVGGMGGGSRWRLPWAHPLNPTAPLPSSDRGRRHLGGGHSTGGAEWGSGKLCVGGDGCPTGPLVGNPAGEGVGGGGRGAGPVWSLGRKPLRVGLGCLGGGGVGRAACWVGVLGLCGDSGGLGACSVWERDLAAEMLNLRDVCTLPGGGGPGGGGGSGPALGTERGAGHGAAWGSGSTAPPRRPGPWLPPWTLPGPEGGGGEVVLLGAGGLEDGSAHPGRDHPPSPSPVAPMSPKPTPPAAALLLAPFAVSAGPAGPAVCFPEFAAAPAAPTGRAMALPAASAAASPSAFEALPYPLLLQPGRHSPSHQSPLPLPRCTRSTSPYTSPRCGLCRSCCSPCSLDCCSL
ncbi:unnamed protein product [Closterium sp. NIES-64]|nr:unnamed protein product [Closterium sp. NIES-64]